VKVAVAEEAPPATQGDFEGLGTDA
jgi:hypothetical protein